MISARAFTPLAIVFSLGACGGEASEPEAPKGELVLARDDLRYVVGDTAAGDMILATDDGTVLALDAARVPTVVVAALGRLGTDFDIEIAGGAVLLWRKSGSDSWDLSAWSRAAGLRVVGTAFPRRASSYTAGTPDGERIVFATGGSFENGRGIDLVVQGARLSQTPPSPVELARVPADYSVGFIEVALVGDRAIVKRYTERALRPDLASQRTWPESEEPWEAAWFDESWQYRGTVPHTEELSLGDAALRVATNGAEGALRIEALDGSEGILVDEGCRFARAFFLPGDRHLVYSCRGVAYKFEVATRARTALGNGISGAYPLQCGETRCRDWVGARGTGIVAVEGGASLSVPPGSITSTGDGTLDGKLSPDGRFAVVPADGGAISLVALGTTTASIVLDTETRLFGWLDGARFTYATTNEANASNWNASMTVHWRDANAERPDEVIAREVLTPVARAAEHALYAIVKATDRPSGLYRFPMPN